jgi:hypothetical protein
MLEIRESQIEDIFATQLDEVRALLSIDNNITLINRQKKLPSGGILDLLFLSSNHLLLIELKAVRSKIKFCEQLIEYRNDLNLLQNQNQMPNLPIKSYLICTEFDNNHIFYCQEREIIPIKFSPYELLKNYYFKIKVITGLIALKPSNHGLWNLYLLNRILYVIPLSEEILIPSVVKKTELSKSTVGSYLRLSNELGLTSVEKYKAKLTRLGIEFVKKRDIEKPVDYISDEQTQILKEYILKIHLLARRFMEFIQLLKPFSFYQRIFILYRLMRQESFLHN